MQQQHSVGDFPLAAALSLQSAEKRCKAAKRKAPLLFLMSSPLDGPTTLSLPRISAMLMLLVASDRLGDTRSLRVHSSLFARLLHNRRCSPFMVRSADNNVRLHSLRNAIVLLRAIISGSAVAVQKRSTVLLLLRRIATISPPKKPHSPRLESIRKSSALARRVDRTHSNGIVIKNANGKKKCGNWIRDEHNVQNDIELHNRK